VKSTTPIITLLFALLLFAGCRAPLELLETGELERADISTEELVDMVPDYSDKLLTLSGSGRAFISQPGNSDRVTVDFHSNREASLVTFRNRLGMEGGQLLVEEDSVLVYNRIDKVAEKISLKDANLTEVGTLATINLVELFHYPFHRGEITEIYQDDQYFVAITADRTRITIDNNSGFIMDLQTHPDSGAPYSRISYESYESQEGFYLPKKITIFSQDGSTRVTMLVRHLQANKELPELKIQIPDEVPIISI
jgi:hypothetical protein